MLYSGYGYYYYNGAFCDKYSAKEKITVKSKIDLEQLRCEIRRLHRSHALYRLLRDELSALKLWKARPRGNPKKGYEVAHGLGNGTTNKN